MLYSLGRDVQGRGDLAIALPFRHQRQHLQLLIGQARRIATRGWPWSASHTACAGGTLLALQAFKRGARDLRSFGRRAPRRRITFAERKRLLIGAAEVLPGGRRRSPVASTEASVRLGEASRHS